MSLESYPQTKVIMAPSGELILALPIFADVNKTILNEKELSIVFNTKVNKLNLGYYEPIGYIIYTDQFDFTVYFNSIEHFEVLSDV